MNKKILIILIALPLILLVLSLMLGRYPISPITTLEVLASKFIAVEPTWAENVELVIFQLRLPRALLALLVGAALSISGSAYQGMFQNPLVSPDILGVSASAGFGAALAILFSYNAALIQTSAFVFGLVGVLIAYLLSRVYKSAPVLMLVLSGVVVAAFFSALISAVKFVADPYEKLPIITFWLMGSLGNASIKDLINISIPMAVGITGLMLVRWQINVLAMGDEEARALGVKTELLKAILIVCTTIVTASAVCVSGIIGWVGLIIPHVTRMLVGPDHRVLLPASLAIGASYLLIIDILARTLTPAEIPLGILTALIGAPFFAFLLRKTKGGWK